MHVPVHFSLAAKLHQCRANLLTMAGIFADRPHVYMCVYVSVYKLWPFEIILFFFFYIWKVLLKDLSLISISILAFATLFDLRQITLKIVILLIVWLLWRLE